MDRLIFQADAFTDHPFGGNPAAVCISPGPCEETWMQSLAEEMNLSETAILWRERDGFRLRWFTPKVEVDLCGHATLASAHVLWEQGYAPRDHPIQFWTRSGTLIANRADEWIELDFPATPPDPASGPPGLLEALGVHPRFIGRSKHHFLLELEDESAVRAASPAFATLARLSDRGVIITSLTEMEGYDFVSRFFAPAYGINEDPATGSAHCALGPYWMERLGKREFLAYQASARGGTVRVRVGGERVYLGGQAVTVFRGELPSGP